jgi:hypothetical protein
MVQVWLLRQADVEYMDWPPRAPNTNPIESMWGEVKKTMQYTSPALSPTDRQVSGHLCQTFWLRRLGVMFDL